MFSVMYIYYVGMIRNYYLGKTTISWLKEKSSFKKLKDAQFLLFLFSFAELRSLQRGEG